MVINFSSIKLKQSPNERINLTINLTENDINIQNPTNIKKVDIDINTLTSKELKCMNDFIDLLKSKL
jgi:hypothetical protein